jgi:hypothetical protein
MVALMGASEYLLIQAELSAMHCRLDRVAQKLNLQGESEARSSIQTAMDSVLLAEDQLCESHLASTSSGSHYVNAYQCFQTLSPISRDVGVRQRHRAV